MMPLSPPGQGLPCLEQILQNKTQGVFQISDSTLLKSWFQVGQVPT